MSLTPRRLFGASLVCYGIGLTGFWRHVWWVQAIAGLIVTAGIALVFSSRSCPETGETG